MCVQVNEADKQIFAELFLCAQLYENTKNFFKKL